MFKLEIMVYELTPDVFAIPLYKETYNFIGFNVCKTVSKQQHLGHAHLANLCLT